MQQRVPVIQLRGVSKTYDGETTTALHETSLDIHRGEVTLLMGPSGSGKTTLLSIMGGILRPTSGEVWVSGTDVAALNESQLPAVRLNNIGFVFQSFNLMSTLSALENVELAVSMHGMKGRAARRAALELLEAMGLADKAGSWPSDLSGGQKQRVAIARALAGSPEAVLADEPTASLDSVSGWVVMKRFQEVARRGCAVVVVSHDQRIVEFADRIVHMEDGRVASDTRPNPVRPVMIPAQIMDVPARSAVPWGKSAGLAAAAAAAAAVIWQAGLWTGAKPAGAEANSVAAASVTAPPAPASPPTGGRIAGSAKVEPLSEEINVGATLSGRVLVHVKEGQAVRAGQLIATMESGDLAARLEQARAQVRLREADVASIQAGVSPFDRQKAENAVTEAQTLVQNAATEIRQREALVQTGDMPRVELERWVREKELAEIRLRMALVHRDSLMAPARTAEVARGQAQLAAAQAAVQEAEVMAGRARILAPQSGVVLKRYRRTGDTVGLGDPIVSLGDTSRLAVRMDVDETDLARIRVGDAAYCTAQAFGDRRFPGKVVQLARKLGRRNIETGDPQEKTDTRVLEALIELDGRPELPVGLRMVAFVESGK